MVTIRFNPSCKHPRINSGPNTCLKRVRFGLGTSRYCLQRPLQHVWQRQVALIGLGVIGDGNAGDESDATQA